MPQLCLILQISVRSTAKCMINFREIMYMYPATYVRSESGQAVYCSPGASCVSASYKLQSRQPLPARIWSSMSAYLVPVMTPITQTQCLNVANSIIIPMQLLGSPKTVLRKNIDGHSDNGDSALYPAQREERAE